LNFLPEDFVVVCRADYFTLSSTFIGILVLTSSVSSFLTDKFGVPFSDSSFDSILISADFSIIDAGFYLKVMPGV
jgi:hypothetical protein